MNVGFVSIVPAKTLKISLSEANGCISFPGLPEIDLQKDFRSGLKSLILTQEATLIFKSNQLRFFPFYRLQSRTVFPITLKFQLASANNLKGIFREQKPASITSSLKIFTLLMIFSRKILVFTVGFSRRIKETKLTRLFRLPPREY